mmetsp:Transcript_22300/g.39221  ORF Transcript_22300/g.39221 Transcript_22300/m.39221 type:complete len:218 (+) Transcript_22300:374-1027(+)
MFCLVRQRRHSLFVLGTAAILPVMIPDDPVHASPFVDIFCTVSSITQMHYGTADLVMVGMLELSMIRLSERATKDERGTGKVFIAQTNIECNIGIVSMHIKAQIFIRLVSHDKGMVIVKDLALCGKQDPRNGPNVLLLQCGNHGPHPNLVENDPVIVHAVWSSYGNVMFGRDFVKVKQLFVDHFQEGFAQTFKGIHSRGFQVEFGRNLGRLGVVHGG